MQHVLHETHEKQTRLRRGCAVTPSQAWGWRTLGAEPHARAGRIRVARAGVGLRRVGFEYSLAAWQDLELPFLPGTDSGQNPRSGTALPFAMPEAPAGPGLTAEPIPTRPEAYMRLAREGEMPCRTTSPYPNLESGRQLLTISARNPLPASRRQHCSNPVFLESGLPCLATKSGFSHLNPVTVQSWDSVLLRLNPAFRRMWDLDTGASRSGQFEIVGFSR